MRTLASHFLGSCTSIDLALHPEPSGPAVIQQWVDGLTGDKVLTQINTFPRHDPLVTAKALRTMIRKAHVDVQRTRRVPLSSKKYVALEGARMADFSEVVEVHWAELYRLAHLLAGDSTTADDLLQSALLRALRAWDKVEEAESVRAYLKRIVTNTAIDESRKRRRRPLVLTDTPPDVGHTEEPSVLERERLWPLIAALPLRQRAVLVLRYYEDLSEAQTAEVLGCRPGTVKSQTFAAIQKLRAQLIPVPRLEGDHRHDV